MLYFHPNAKYFFLFNYLLIIMKQSLVFSKQLHDYDNNINIFLPMPSLLKIILHYLRKTLPFKL